MESKHLSTEGIELDEEFRYLTLPPTSATFTDAGSTGAISTPATTPPPPDSATHVRKMFAGGPSPRHSSQYSPMAPPPKLPLPALPPSSTVSSPRSSVSTQFSSVPRSTRHHQPTVTKRGQSHSPSPPSTSSDSKATTQLRLSDMPPRSPRDQYPPSNISKNVIVESPTRLTHQQHRKRNSIEDSHRKAAVAAGWQQQQMQPKTILDSVFSERNQNDTLFRDYTPASQNHVNTRRGGNSSSQSKGSSQLSTSTSGNKNALMLNTSATGRYPAQHQQQRHVHQSRHHQEAMANGDDVVMNDETATNADQQTDFDEADFEHLTLPKAAQAAMEQKISSRNDNFEAAWADDASCIDVSDRYQESEDQDGPPEETFEVAALRRQVEQLQMALQRQMATQRQTSARVAQQKRSVAEMRVPFGMPTPSKSFDSGSTLQNRSTSSKASYRGGDLSSDVDQVTEYAENYGVDRRRLVSHRSQGQFSHPYMYNLGSGGTVPFRKAKRGSIVSSLFDESASTFGRKEDAKKVDELAKKIEALEKMFQTSSVSSMSPTEERLQHQYLAANDVRRSPIEERHSPISPRSIVPNRMELQQNNMLRKTSMATMSDRDGRRSPAASAFHFNPTPYSAEEYAASMGRLRNNSSGSINAPNARTKSVARFIMGVGSSRSNVSRDEYGNPLPSMQVSWSRKRTEKVAKPTTTAKMKVGPGRGRIVMKPQPQSQPQS